MINLIIDLLKNAFSIFNRQNNSMKTHARQRRFKAFQKMSLNLTKSALGKNITVSG